MDCGARRPRRHPVCCAGVAGLSLRDGPSPVNRQTAINRSGRTIYRAPTLCPSEAISLRPAQDSSCGGLVRSLAGPSTGYYRVTTGFVLDDLQKHRDFSTLLASVQLCLRLGRNPVNSPKMPCILVIFGSDNRVSER